MSVRVSTVLEVRQRWQPPRVEADDHAGSEMLRAADQIARAANDLRMLNEVLNQEGHRGGEASSEASWKLATSAEQPAGERQVSAGTWRPFIINWRFKSQGNFARST